MGSELFTKTDNTEVLTSEQVIDFITSFKKPIICQVCGNQQWDVFVTHRVKVKDDTPEHTIIETIGYAQFIAEEDRAVNYPGALPIIRMTCGTCGNVLIFSYKAVRDHILKKSAASEVEKSE
ncbi:TPA: hypothetical protein PFE10_003080 [Kluyvera ascorbata]|nr:hypothetical protein [Kluyvera ascorbata]